MAEMYVVAGSALQKMDESGVLTTLTLPTDVTITSRQPRWASLANLVVLSNAPTRTLLIDPSDDLVYPLVPAAPSSVVTLAAGAAGSLTGDYKVRLSFLIKDAQGSVLSESPLGPESAVVTLASDVLSITNIPISPDSGVNSVRIYRTLTAGAVYFHDEDLDGNTQTTATLTKTDEAISIIPAPTNLGLCPGAVNGDFPMEHVTQWKGKLWGHVGATIKVDRDILRWTDSRLLHAWSPKNSFPVPPVGEDEFGITGFIPRKDFLGIGKRDNLISINNPDPLSGELRQVANGIGIVSQESVQVIRDVGYFLAEDGVYRWDDSGVTNISRKHVHPWFTTDTTFARANFKLAKSWYDSEEDTYNLLLPATSQATLNRWVSYYIREDLWLGPHLTTAFTPTFAITTEDASDITLPLIAGSAGFFWKKQATRTDNTATAIAVDIDTPFHSGNTPDITKVWLQPSLLTKVESAGSATLTPKAGGLDAAAQTAITADLTLGRERLRHIGVGRFAQFNITKSDAGEDFTLYGYELPFVERGRR